jgi:site-specific recombinase XerC
MKDNAMKDLNYQLKRLCHRNRDGSYAKQTARERILTQIAHVLDQLGFKHMNVNSLKPKHVDAVVEHMKGEGLSTGTIKNRLCEMRWWAEKIGKQNVVAKSNDHYGIEQRVFVTNVSKARELDAAQLQKVSDAYTRASLQLQAAFGLRREESIKIRPAQADHGDRLVLQASWTKSGREREIPIATVEQRQVLDHAKELAGKGSLIPADKSYVQQLKRFEYQCNKAGIDHVHGHRHAFAQQRYAELTGWLCPAAGGPHSKQLTARQKATDREVRLIISRELGHAREQITAVYLGR